MPMTLNECRELVCGGGHIENISSGVLVHMAHGGQIVCQNGSYAGDRNNPWHPNFNPPGWRKRVPQPVSRLVRHEVRTISGNQFLRANGDTVDDWIGRHDFVGCTFKGSDVMFNSTVIYRMVDSDGNAHGELHREIDPIYLHKGEAIEVHPIEVWQRVGGKK